MKLKKDIKEALDKSWEMYSLNIEKFADSKCEDVETFMKGVRMYGRIEALHWFLQNNEQQLGE